MDNSIWYDTFVELLYKKFPKKAQLTRELMSLLSIEREAVYRRLRKEVAFPVHEIVKIAAAWSISLDEMTGVDSGEISFQLKMMNYISPSEEEIKFLQYVIQSIEHLKNYQEVEFMDICNKLPRQFLAGYDYLNRFYLFKLTCQYGGEKEIIPFSQINISEEKLQITRAYYKAIKHVPNSSFVFDSKVFQYLINDIRYFHSIYLVTDEEKELIKKDLYALLDYMLEVAIHGAYPETHNKVNFYISQLYIDTNYTYTFTPEVSICFIHIFEKFEMFSYNSEMVANFMSWMRLKRKTSIQISEVDEKSRIDFFTTQRRLIDGL